jgi:hypothetical protein
MPNDVFRAGDAVLVFGVEDAASPEGAAADAVVSAYDLSNVVGRLTDVRISVATDVRPFYELGRRYPTHLRAGSVYVSGTAARAHVNGALLRLLLGDGAMSPPSSGNFVQPALNIVATLRNPAVPDNMTRLTVFGARFDRWTYRVPAEDVVVEQASFKALRIAFEEA